MVNKAREIRERKGQTRIPHAYAERVLTELTAEVEGGKSGVGARMRDRGRNQINSPMWTMGNVQIRRDEAIWAERESRRVCW